MHDTARDADPHARAQSGDVDADGEIVDALRRRLDEAIGTDTEGERAEHRERVLRVVAHAKRKPGFPPGVRLVDGEPHYSAAWLDVEPDLLVVGNTHVLETRDGRIFLHDRARR